MSKDVYMEHKLQRQLVKPLPQLQETNGKRGSGESELQVAPGVVSKQVCEERHGAGAHAPQHRPHQRLHWPVLHREQLDPNGRHARDHPLSWLIDFCCITSTEARRTIRDGDEWERGTEEWNLETGANTKDQGCRGPPPEQQDVKCPSGIAQRPQHHPTAVPNAMQNRVTMTISLAPPMGNNWRRRSSTLSLSL